MVGEVVCNETRQLCVRVDAFDSNNVGYIIRLNMYSNICPMAELVTASDC